MMWKSAFFAAGVAGVAWLAHAADPLGPSFTDDAAPRIVVAAKKEAAPAIEEKLAASKVLHVTIYPNSALITREVQVPEGTGPMELVVGSLPVQIVNSSLYSEGSNGTRVLSTRFRTRPVKEDTREDVRKIEDQLKQLGRDVQRIDADLAIIQQNMTLLTKLETFASADTKNATEKGQLNAESVITLSKHVMAQRAEKSKEQVALQQERQDKQEQIEYAQRQLREASAGRARSERDAVIVLDKAEKPAATVKLNYLVDSVAWRPQYKLRSGKTEKEAVQIEYLAAIIQQTGEDWSNVGLTLSTAQPMLNAAPPDLKSLEVAVMPRGSMNVAFDNVPPPPGANRDGGSRGGNPGQPAAQGGGQFGQLGGQFGGQGNQALQMEIDNQAKALRQQAASEYNKKQEQSGGLLINSAAALEQANELWNAEDRVATKGKPIARASTNREGPSVNFHLKTKLSIPSRNDEQVLEVTRLEMAPDYFYKAVPILSPHVYRLANLTNSSEYVLLPGEATMYLGTDFVGRMNLPLVAIGEQFTAGFGADPQLQVSRQMIEKSATMAGGNQVLKYEYRILLSSYKSQAVNLQLWDRLPVAENEKTVVINLNKVEPEISKDSIYLREHRPKNLLRWDLKIEPGMSGEKAFPVGYDFKVELDKQMTIGNVATK